VTQQFQQMIDSGKLSVNFRRGRMIVELPATVLFASARRALARRSGRAQRSRERYLPRRAEQDSSSAAYRRRADLQAQGSYSSNWALSARAR